MKKYTFFKGVRIIKFCLMLLLFLSVSNVWSQTKFIPKGSVVIDMGVVPQTTGNAMKPYGLVYSLIKDYATPVIWSVNTSKGFEGIDFTVDGKDFKGGPFIIVEELVTSQVQSVISSWESQGVVTYITQSDVTVPMHKELKFFANWVLDTQNGAIAEPYIENAGIPTSAFTTALPTTLDECDDLFVMPHADPTWANHGEDLLKWNKSVDDGGNDLWIWAGCHAVSVLEELKDPNSSDRTNFLSEDPPAFPVNGLDGWGLINFDDHADASGTTPYEMDYHGHPFMQFMGRTDGAHAGGSEQVFIPYPDGAWRSSTRVAVWDEAQTDYVSGGSDPDEEAALIVFGPGMGDYTRGWVMYEGGHKLDNGTSAENIAAQRAFLNFSFDAPTGKVPRVTANVAPPESISWQSNFQMDITGFIPDDPGGNITYEWSASDPNVVFSSTTVDDPQFHLLQTLP
jgi:hypothetical protein